MTTEIIAVCFCSQNMRSPHHSNHQTAIAYSSKIKAKRSPHYSITKMRSPILQLKELQFVAKCND
ncbi:MAG: hypothetical protein WCP16_26575 [Pseudanabaena sp. ELA645]